MVKRELVSLLSLSSWCLLFVVWLFLAVPWVCLQFLIVVFPDHAHLLFLTGKEAIVIWIVRSNLNRLVEAVQKRSRNPYWQCKSVI